MLVVDCYHSYQQMSDQSKFIAETITLIHSKIPDKEQEAHVLMNKLRDKFMHTAPEIINYVWKDIYIVCSRHFNRKDVVWHKDVFETYNTRYAEFTDLFK